MISDPRSVKVRHAIETLLSEPAHCSSELRCAINDYACRRSTGPATAIGIPAELVSYIDKIVLYAYKVSDDDIDRLRAAGYSEDALFEITLCASSGAADARLMTGLQALAQANAVSHPNEAK